MCVCLCIAFKAKDELKMLNTKTIFFRCLWHALTSLTVTDICDHGNVNGLVLGKWVNIPPELPQNGTKYKSNVD